MTTNKHSRKPKMKNEMEKIRKAEITARIAKAVRNYSFVFLAGMVISFMAYKCDTESVNTPPTTDTLQTQNIEIKRRIIPRAHRIEQAKAEIPKAQIKAQTYYDTIIVYMPDTCKPYLSSYKAYRDSMEQLLMYVVASQDSTIRDQDTIIRNDSIMLVRAYKSVEDTVKYYKKEVRRRGFKRIIQAGVAGVVGGLIIGNQLKK